MRTAPTWLGVVALGAGLTLAGMAGCGSAPSSAAARSIPASPSVKTSAPARPASASPSPAVTRTVIKTVQASPSATHTSAAPAPAATPQPVVVPNVTDPWAVVSAYYGDVESGDYQQAYALLGGGMTTGQTYLQFVAGYACTGGQTVSENWESGDQVNFDLAAYDACSGAEQDYTGTDTVENGQIVAADITQSG
jgi:hypothetical protein